MRLVVVSGILFLSGCSALLFETLWLRLSGLAFGNSVWSAALILSSFMAGLALGSAIAASSTIRWRPLRMYAELELIVALFGCSLVFGLPQLGHWLAPLFQTLWDHQQLLNVLRFGISSLILLVPSTAIGLSLPVLLEEPTLKQHDFGRTIGALYGFNTLGAVVGALLGEAYLVESVGLFGTGLAAAGMSGAAAAIAWFLAGRATPAVAFKTTMRLRMLVPSAHVWPLVIVSAGTGALLLALEVIWFRFLRLYVVSTSTAFSVMLAVVLVALGLGGLASSLIPRQYVTGGRALPFLLLLSALLTLLCYQFFPVPPPQLDLNVRSIDSWRHIAAVSSALMFPVAFLSGIVLPVLVAEVQEEVPGRMNSAGLTIFFNTLGAAAGPLMGAFVLLPYVGVQGSLLCCVGAYAALGLFLASRITWTFARLPGVSFLVLVTALVTAVLAFPTDADERHFANARAPYELDGSRLIKRVEGTADTLQLLRRNVYDEPYYYRLVTNAYSMSGTLPRSQRYMRLFAYLPLVLRPQSEDALLLCYGVGVTADALTRAKDLKRIDLVDISEEVFQLAPFYSGPGYANPLLDARVTPIVQDARFFLQASPRRYDIITGEPPPLKTAGTVNLYTEQFFSLMRGRLKDGGVATFWLPIYQLSVAETKAILRAFHNVFPNASVWATSDLEWIMTGIKEPFTRPQQRSVDSLWDDPLLRADLVRFGVEVPEQLSALFLMDNTELGTITEGVEPLTDFYPKRLTDSPVDIQTVHKFAFTYFEHEAALNRFLSSALIEQVWPYEQKQSLASYFLIRETRYLSEFSGSNWLAELDLYLRRTSLRGPVLAVQNSDEFRLALAAGLAAKNESVSVEALHDLVSGRLARRDLAGAIGLLERQKLSGFMTPNDLFLLTYLYCLNAEVGKAEALAAGYVAQVKKDWFRDWVWAKLQAEFGFRPPS